MGYTAGVCLSLNPLHTRILAQIALGFHDVTVSSNEEFFPKTQRNPHWHWGHCYCSTPRVHSGADRDIRRVLSESEKKTQCLLCLISQPTVKLRARWPHICFLWSKYRLYHGTTFVSCVSWAAVCVVWVKGDVNTKEMTGPWSLSSMLFSCATSPAFVSTFPEGLSPSLAYHYLCGRQRMEYKCGPKHLSLTPALCGGVTTPTKLNQINEHFIAPLCSGAQIEPRDGRWELWFGVCECVLWRYYSALCNPAVFLGWLCKCVTVCVCAHIVRFTSSVTCSLWWRISPSAARRKHIFSYWVSKLK